MGLRDYVYMAIIAIGGIGGTAAWIKHDHVERAIGAKAIVAATQKGADEQKQKDDLRLKQAKDSYDQEISRINAAYSAPVADAPVVVCHNTLRSNVPAPAVHANQPAAPAVVQADSAVHPDVTPALELLAKYADGLSARARLADNGPH
jgi:hypothetical protein